MSTTIETGCGKDARFQSCRTCILEHDPGLCHEWRELSGERLMRAKDTNDSSVRPEFRDD